MSSEAQTLERRALDVVWGIARFRFERFREGSLPDDASTWDQLGDNDRLGWFSMVAWEIAGRQK